MTGGDEQTGATVVDTATVTRLGADNRLPKDKAALRAEPTHTSGCTRCSWTRSGLTLKQARRAFLDHVSEAHSENLPRVKRDRRMVDAETKERALALLAQGMSARAAAREVGVGVSTVLRWSRAAAT